MRFTVDTNVLVYALDADDPDKQALARHILRRGRENGMVLAAQVLGEFLNAVRRRRPAGVDEAIRLVDLWSQLYRVRATTAEDIVGGGRLAMRHRLQFWDSVILEIARSENATMLLTEDMQDGATLNHVTIVNPFVPANRARLDQILST